MAVLYRFRCDVHVVGGCARLDDAGSLPRHADVLIVEISELDVDALAPIQRARDATETSAVVVLYRFCASTTIRTEADAQLHLALQDAAGQARGILENAMARLLHTEGVWPLAG